MPIGVCEIKFPIAEYFSPTDICLALAFLYSFVLSSLGNLLLAICFLFYFGAFPRSCKVT